jgi:ADP-heptose:LPS heptosyltransferase
MISASAIIPHPNRILIIQFKYLGDAVFITPALQALQAQYPSAEIHMLVSDEVAPIFEHATWITKTWVLPRKRGKSKFFESWPVIKKIRDCNFDLSIDFVGNDRGALLSLLIHAKYRIAPLEKKPNLLRKFAYTKLIPAERLPISWVKRHFEMLKLSLNTPIPSNLKMLIASDPLCEDQAEDILKGHTVICHVGTSQQKKEWPIQRWRELYVLAKNSGYQLAFSAGPNEREQDILTELKKQEPDIFLLPPLLGLKMYLAVLKQSRVVISGDTGPLHFAAGLVVKIIGLFGTTDSVLRAAPIYDENEAILSKPCKCVGGKSKFVTCQKKESCMDSINASDVFKMLKEYG